jgi:hypothetical protein
MQISTATPPEKQKKSIVYICSKIKIFDWRGSLNNETTGQQSVHLFL